MSAQKMGVGTSVGCAGQAEEVAPPESGRGPFPPSVKSLGGPIATCGLRRREGVSLAELGGGREGE